MQSHILGLHDRLVAPSSQTPAVFLAPANWRKADSSSLFLPNVLAALQASRRARAPAAPPWVSDITWPATHARAPPLGRLPGRTLPLCSPPLPAPITLHSLPSPSSPAGVCGKTPETAVLQDLLTYSLKGLVRPSVFCMSVCLVGWMECAAW